MTWQEPASMTDTEVEQHYTEGCDMGISLNGLNSGLADTYSSLLSGAGSGSSGGFDGSSLLTDYAAIKNGSYGKMMKSYYSKMKAEESEEEEKTSSSKSKKIKDASSASAASSLYRSASKLGTLNYDDHSEENVEEITDAVSAFIKDYNNLMKSGSKSDNATVKKQTDALYDTYYSNYKLFAKIGITMNSDKTLSLDKDTFKKGFTDDSGRAGTVKTLFGGIGSFADKAADRASRIYRAAGDGESVTSSKAKYAGTTGSTSSGSSTSKTNSSSSNKDISKTAEDPASAASASTLYKSVEKLGAMDISNDNKDKVYDAFSAFVKDYNALIKNTNNSKNSNVIKQADYLKSLVSGNKSAFSRMGVTVNSDKTLSIDETKFKEADMGNVKNLFSGVYSFGEKMTDRINSIYRYASQGESLLNKTYTSQGGYSSVNAGSTLDTTL